MERLIVVKEPSIRIRPSKEKLSLNETVTILKKGMGYPEDGVIITVENNGILEQVGETKFRAVRTGKAVITAKYKDILVNTIITVE